MKTLRILLPLAALLALAACDRDYTRKGDTVTVKAEEGLVRLQVISPGIVRVSSTPDAEFPERQSLMIVPQKGCTDFSVSEENGVVTVTTAALKAVVDNGWVSFTDLDGNPLLEEYSRSFEPITIEGRTEYTVTQEWDSPSDEAIYGLGQQQDFLLDHKGDNVELYQYNTKISMPFFVSSKGYGVLWDSYSMGRFGNPKGYLQLGEVFKLYDRDGKEGALTATYTPADGKPVTRREEAIYYEDEWAVRDLPKIPMKGAKVAFEGYIVAPYDGDYYFSLYYAGFQKVSVAGKEVVGEVWRPAWNPNIVKFKVNLKAGEKTPLRVDWRPDGAVSYTGLRAAPYRTPEEQGRLCFWSEMNPCIDYYFIAGPSADTIISGYRTLTGKAQVMPRWAMGFWQSRERYTSQEEIVSTLAEFRRRGIPIDNIVQDWQYWKPDQWGSHEFDETRFPDPEKMLDDIHSMHGRFMISVWPKFYTSTKNFEEMRDHGYVFMQSVKDSLLDFLGYPETFYDAYNPDAQKMFWRQMDENLYTKYGRKIDSWWMDASEPNLRDCQPWPYQKLLTTPTALGPSTEYFNAYALVNANAIYNGQREVDPDKRVFLLTRSGFPGLQRYSTASWSGDIGTSWVDMRAQITAGLGYSVSGIPFWGMDIGGFSVMDKFYDPANVEEWREMQARWHQFGAFVPIFRTHGQWPAREIWNIAPEGSAAYESILYYDKLRYRLMPYLYSLAGKVHFDDYTIMRPLFMDFCADADALRIDDQWMFGPAFMPCPVTEYKARSREVYLPAGAGWYEFETWNYLPGGQTVTADAPYGRLPLYVRAGSIVPTGRDMQWSDEFPADEITLMVYPGTDADFELYEDENTNYNYEKGAFSTIAIHWDDAAKTLSIASREGSFPGMLEKRAFTVCCPPLGHVGDIRIDYSGEAVSVKL